MNLQDFHDWLLAERDVAPSTAKESMRHMQRLDDAGVTVEALAVGPAEAQRAVRPFLAALAQGGKKSMKRAFQKTLNRFAAYLAQIQGGSWRYYERKGPWDLSAETKRRFDPYTDDELAAIAAYRHPMAFVNARRRALIHLLLVLGERRGQIWRFQVEDFDARRMAVNIAHPIKGGSPRWENLPARSFHPSGSLAAWLLQRATVAEPKGALWVTVSGSPMSLDGFAGEIYDIRRELQVPLNHNRFRHTRGVSAYRANMPVQVQQDEWGHGDPKNTLWYMRGTAADRRPYLESAGLPGWD